jgi:hypothetical protein
MKKDLLGSIPSASKYKKQIDNVMTKSKGLVRSKAPKGVKLTSTTSTTKPMNADMIKGMVTKAKDNAMNLRNKITSGMATGTATNKLAKIKAMTDEARKMAKPSIRRRKNGGLS